MCAVQRVEPIEVRGFAAEQVHGRHPGDVLLQEGVDPRDAGADFTVRLAHVAPEPLGHDDDQRQHREGHRREPPVHRDQHDQDAGQHHDVAEHRDHAGREQIVQRVDVARHPRHQPSDGVPIVVAEAEPLELRVDLQPEVEHDPLAQHLGHPGLSELEQERHHEQREERQGDARDARQIAGGDVAIDGELGEPRLRELHQRTRDDRHQAEAHVQPCTAAGTRAAAASGGSRRLCRERPLRACRSRESSAGTSSTSQQAAGDQDHAVELPTRHRSRRRGVRRDGVRTPVAIPRTDCCNTLETQRTDWSGGAT